MIHKFNNQEERRNFGGSAFIEIAYCKLKPRTKVKKVFKLKNLPMRSNDSLYVHVDDMHDFIEIYSDIFGKCICANLNEYDSFDPFCINYYSKDCINIIKEKLLEARPKDYEMVLKWLEESDKYNGFYILGI